LKGILAVSIAVLVLAGGVFVLSWAGFAPFPTEPVLLASYQKVQLALGKSGNFVNSFFPIGHFLRR
jgi:multisubunit Na+/H+ antiporter MnhB subunit